MNTDFLDTEMELLRNNCESLFELMRNGMSSLKVEKAIKCLTQLKAQSALNIQKLAKLDPDAQQKAEKWDNLYKVVHACYFDDNGNEIPDDQLTTDLTTIGEITASKMKFI